MHLACHKGGPDVVQYLLNETEDKAKLVNAKADLDFTPLHYCCLYNSRSHEIVNILLQTQGIRINAVR